MELESRSKNEYLARRDNRRLQSVLLAKQRQFKMLQSVHEEDTYIPPFKKTESFETDDWEIVTSSEDANNIGFIAWAKSLIAFWTKTREN